MAVPMGGLTSRRNEEATQFISKRTKGNSPRWLKRSGGHNWGKWRYFNKSSHPYHKSKWAQENYIKWQRISPNYINRKSWLKLKGPPVSQDPSKGLKEGRKEGRHLSVSVFFFKHGPQIQTHAFGPVSHLLVFNHKLQDRDQDKPIL